MAQQLPSWVSTMIADNLILMFTASCSCVLYPTGFAPMLLLQSALQVLAGAAWPSFYATFAAGATLVGRLRHGGITWRQLATGVKEDLRGLLAPGSTTAVVWAGSLATAGTAWLYLRLLSADTVTGLLCIASSYRYMQRGERWTLAVAHFTAVYSFCRSAGLAPGLLLVSARMLLHIALLYLRIMLVVFGSQVGLYFVVIAAVSFFGKAAMLSMFNRAREARPAEGPVPLPTSWSQLLGDGEWLGEGEQMTMRGPVGSWVNDFVAYQPAVVDGQREPNAQARFKVQAIGGGTFSTPLADGSTGHYGVQYNMRFYSLPADFQGGQQGVAAVPGAVQGNGIAAGGLAALVPQGSGGLAEQVAGSAARTLLRRTSSKTVEF